MRIQFKLLSIALLVTGAAAQAQQAPSALYGELALAPIQMKGDSDSGTSKNLRGIIGYELHPNVAIEGMVSFGVKSGSLTILGERIETSVDHAMACTSSPRSRSRSISKPSRAWVTRGQSSPPLWYRLAITPRTRSPVRPTAWVCLTESMTSCLPLSTTYAITTSTTLDIKGCPSAFA